MGISRKTWVLFAMAAVVALAFALPAFATVGDSGYLTWDSMGGANGTSPHGGYTTTTNKCAVCHSVHNADPMGELLLRGAVVDACTYCHVGGGGGYTTVYGGDTNNFNVADLDNAHNYWTVGLVEQGVLCTSCHQVHGASNAMTNNGYLTSKILKGQKTNVANAYDPFASAPLASDTPTVAVTKWCTSCHDSSLNVGYAYYNGADWSGGVADTSGMPYIRSSHVMTDDIASYTFPDGTSAQVAWAGSANCSSCHASGFGTSAWPHFTPGARFLTSAGSVASATPDPATDPSDDGVCLRCHRDGAGAGVGLGW